MNANLLVVVFLHFQVVVNKNCQLRENYNFLIQCDYHRALEKCWVVYGASSIPLYSSSLFLDFSNYLPVGLYILILIISG